MKSKFIPYLLIGIVVVATGFLIYTATNNKVRVLDQRLSFRKSDKIPYGTYVAYRGLQYLFPKASVSAGKNEPGYWDSLSNYESGQALIIVSPVFNADEFEMNKLIRFAQNGNDVFISTAIMSEEAKNMLDCGVSYLDVFDIFSNQPVEEDTLEVSLSDPPFKRSGVYMYPGRRLDCSFYKIDTSTTTVLGIAASGQSNFIHLKTGQGHVYVHLAPMAFTNYFLLRDRNMSYYEDLLSVLSPATRKIVWDEYYLQKRLSYQRGSSGYGKGWLSAVFKNDSLKWGLLTAMVALSVFVLMEMRRKQRIIPVITKPRNDSLDFVKTIGRLYHDKGDHRNLCRKMSAYFLEHVRNRYKLSTAEMNDEFIKNLQIKTGADEGDLRNIVYFIRELESSTVISDRQLAYFHKQLEKFYNKA